jgi:hypothetical protein
VGVAIVVDSEDARDLPDLLAWLRREDELRGRFSFRVVH